MRITIESQKMYQYINTISQIISHSENHKMPRTIRDDEIIRYVTEIKPYDPLLLRSRRPIVIKGHKKKDFEINGVAGTKFKLHIRENVKNPLDFSVGLCLIRDDNGEEFCLRRYNGKSYHRNKCPKGVRFRDFHIHEATEKCQEEGIKEEDRATITNRYSTPNQALTCLLQDCYFRSEQQILPYFWQGV